MTLTFALIRCHAKNMTRNTKLEAPLLCKVIYFHKGCANLTLPVPNLSFLEDEDLSLKYEEESCRQNMFQISFGSTAR